MKGLTYQEEVDEHANVSISKTSLSSKSSEAEQRVTERSWRVTADGQNNISTTKKKRKIVFKDALELMQESEKKQVTMDIDILTTNDALRLLSSCRRFLICEAPHQ